MLSYDKIILITNEELHSKTDLEILNYLDKQFTDINSDDMIKIVNYNTIYYEKILSELCDSYMRSLTNTRKRNKLETQIIQYTFAVSRLKGIVKTIKILDNNREC